MAQHQCWGKCQPCATHWILFWCSHDQVSQRSCRLQLRKVRRLTPGHTALCTFTEPTLITQEKFSRSVRTHFLTPSIFVKFLKNLAFLKSYWPFSPLAVILWGCSNFDSAEPVAGPAKWAWRNGLCHPGTWRAGSWHYHWRNFPGFLTPKTSPDFLVLVGLIPIGNVAATGVRNGAPWEACNSDRCCCKWQNPMNSNKFFFLNILLKRLEGNIQIHKESRIIRPQEWQESRMSGTCCRMRGSFLGVLPRMGQPQLWLALISCGSSFKFQTHKCL